MKQKLITSLEKFKGKKILVVGDLMLDKYIWGSVERISPEAPVQVVNVNKVNYAPGGAANVANNLSALGAKVTVIGIVGGDSYRDILIDEIKKMGIDTDYIVKDESNVTIVKVRILGQHQQLLRVDYEKKEFYNPSTEDKIIENMKSLLKNIDAVIISDYAKGTITDKTASQLISLCKEKIIVVDPKPRHIEYYKGVSLITPNHKEAREAVGFLGLHGLEEDEVGKKLSEELRVPILITQGEKGMSLFSEGKKTQSIPTTAKEVYDVTGAGDTVVATITLALTSGATMEESAILANHAAGIVVGKLGTSTVTVDELKEKIENE